MLTGRKARRKAKQWGLGDLRLSLRNIEDLELFKQLEGPTSVTRVLFICSGKVFSRVWYLAVHNLGVAKTVGFAVGEAVNVPWIWIF